MIKNYLLIFVTLILTCPVYAHQAADVAEPTEKSDRPKTESKWVTESDTVDIDGDIGALTSDARKNWAAACEKWKTELREDNKGSKFPKISCGQPTCSGDAGSKSCHSKGTYTMKTKEE